MTGILTGLINFEPVNFVNDAIQALGDEVSRFFLESCESNLKQGNSVINR